ncbi:MAG: GNAT family N-acetyltransferase [Oscillospiraceae bacterium]|nr:GNAT family N-acetyltransferase [Oscillospiraceae bacterium]
MHGYSFIIRKAGPDDAGAVTRIVKDAFSKYADDSGIHGSGGSLEALAEGEGVTLLDIGRKEVYVASVDGVPVGTVRFELTPGGEAHISRFGVVGGYQSMGIGSSIMSMLDKLLPSLGVRKACLYTASRYGELVRFYYKFGYYVESTSDERGYVRAKMVKEFQAPPHPSCT